MQRIFPPFWSMLLRLSAKVSANGPISRGGNDRSCVGKAEDVDHLRRKQAGHADHPHMAQTCDWLLKNDKKPSDGF